MIEVYCLANNEEQLLPYFMRHYTMFANVILLESCSTDRTVEIAHDLGAEVWTYDTKDEINDQWITYVKNTCWKESKADWVMIVDADEFIYHPDLVNILSTTGATVIRPRFYDMYSETFPTTTGQIYEEVVMGREQLSPPAKMNIFRPSKIHEMNFAPGCHHGSPEGDVMIDQDSGIKTLHMRYLSKEYLVKRNQRHASRLSAINIEKGWGWHVSRAAVIMEAEFDAGFADCVRIC